MKVISDPAGLVPFYGGAFVPTMGALHEGHYELVRRAAAGGTRPVVVSVFVNPTQFNDPKDLARYPRTLERDAEGCRRAGATVVFAPAPEVIYPQDRKIDVPALPDVATKPGLEDAHRPGHFAGVCQVVRRLFDLVKPSAAYFGEKDWQQLRVIAAMTERDRLGVQIVPVETMRESDGLAMSSRNVFLKGDERRAAVGLSEALRAAAVKSSPADAEVRMREVLSERGLGVEYAVVRDAQTLEKVEGKGPWVRPMRALIAARLGAVRLIDNAPWPEGLGGIRG